MKWPSVRWWKAVADILTHRSFLAYLGHGRPEEDDGSLARMPDMRPQLCHHTVRRK